MYDFWYTGQEMDDNMYAVWYMEQQMDDNMYDVWYTEQEMDARDDNERVAQRLIFSKLHTQFTVTQKSNANEPTSRP